MKTGWIFLNAFFGQTKHHNILDFSFHFGFHCASFVFHATLFDVRIQVLTTTFFAVPLQCQNRIPYPLLNPTRDSSSDYLPYIIIHGKG